jgi:hypothetical protein
MAQPLSREEIDRHVQILGQSQDSKLVAASAILLAGSEDRGASDALSDMLGKAEFLNRLDDTTNSRLDVVNLAQVFRTLAEHPSEAVSQLCVAVYASEDFRSLLVRVNFLLGTLAAVRPMSAQAAEVFRTTSAEGFAEVNGPLLIRNESPLALEVFEEIISGDGLESYVRVDMLHRAVLPSRTHLPILQMCARLLDRELPLDVRSGVIETVFDEQSRLWFGPAIGAPMAEPWQAASPETLKLVVGLADRVLGESLEASLRTAVQSTKNEVEDILASRRK